MADETDAAEAQKRGEEPAETKRPSPLKRPGVRLALVIGVLVLVVLGIMWFVHYETRGKYIESTNDAYVRADSVTVAPKVSGYVDQVFVADNQDVKAGQPLVRIDARDYRAQTAQYQAQIGVSEANADAVRANIAQQQAAIAQARAQLTAAEEQARFAASEAARYAPLAASGAETREHYATLRNQAAQARAQANAQRAALAEAERRVGSLQAQVRQAEAQGNAARSQLAAANVNLASTVVRASIDGRIGDKTVRVGQFVQAGTRMMSVVPVSSLYVVANFKETQIGRMRVGQPATVEIDALGGVTLKGHVESISPGTGATFSLLPPQNATGNFTKIVQRVPVRIAIDPVAAARNVLVAGLSATVKVDTISAKGFEDKLQNQQQARR